MSCDVSCEMRVTAISRAGWGAKEPCEVDPDPGWHGGSPERFRQRVRRARDRGEGEDEDEDAVCSGRSVCSVCSVCGVRSRREEEVEGENRVEVERE